MVINLRSLDISAPEHLTIICERHTPEGKDYERDPQVTTEQLARLVTYIEAMDSLGRSVMVEYTTDDLRRCVLRFSSIDNELDEVPDED